jgi:hypothetical protein
MDAYQDGHGRRAVGLLAEEGGEASEGGDDGGAADTGAGGEDDTSGVGLGVHGAAAPSWIREASRRGLRMRTTLVSMRAVSPLRAASGTSAGRASSTADTTGSALNAFTVGRRLRAAGTSLSARMANLVAGALYGRRSGPGVLTEGDGVGDDDERPLVNVTGRMPFPDVQALWAALVELPIARARLHDGSWGRTTGAASGAATSPAATVDVSTRAGVIAAAAAHSSHLLAQLQEVSMRREASGGGGGGGGGTVGWVGWGGGPPRPACQTLTVCR